MRIIHTNGENAIYAFILSKQDEEPYRDCWMTDDVIQHVKVQNLLNLREKSTENRDLKPPFGIIKIR